MRDQLFRAVTVVTGQDDNELVTAHSADQLTAGKAGAENLGKTAEHPVALRVTERIIDMLQIVHVHTDDGKPLMLLAETVQYHFTLATVRKTGQRVGIGLVHQMAARCLLAQVDDTVQEIMQARHGRKHE